MDNVIILAQGLGTRWKENSKIDLPSECKQLVPLGNETIIERTIRQVRRYNDLKLVGWMPLFGHIPNCAKVELRYPGRNILAGIMMLHNQWLHKEWSTLFLLGDVVFSNSTMEHIFNHDGFGGIRFYLRWGENIYTGKKASEVFALWVGPEEEHQTQLWKVLLEMNLEDPKLKLHSLWEVLKNSGAVIIGDYTDDLDSPEEWQQFYPELERLALEDDKQYEMALAETQRNNV